MHAPTRNDWGSDRFAELKPPLPLDEALAEANRCLFCYDAPCTRACPTHIDVPAFIKKIATGNPVGSARTILEANILGASCARVCPTEVLCEGACVMNDLHHKPIDIGRLQRHATDWVIAKNERLFQPGLSKGHRVAVVGSGPAGLSCAAELARLGYDVTIFEAGDTPGGLNTWGVAEYKMPAAAALKEIEWVRELGVEIRCNTRVGAGGDVTLAELEQLHAAIFLGVGLGKVRDIGIDGEDLPGVRDALELIALLKKDRAAAAASLGQRVLVIGGGNTAIDAATQSVRLGAADVAMVYRRSVADMSAYVHEIALARHDGVRILEKLVPVRVVAGGTGNGKVAGLEVERVEIQTDTRGRTIFAPVAGSAQVLACDTILKATGQIPLGGLFAQVDGLIFENGRPVHDPVTLQTSNPRYFTGGDCANGGKEVVNAVAEGKRAARGIDRHLREART